MQWYEIALPFITVALGGGVIGVIVKAFVDNASSKRTSTNEARRDQNSVWDQIVENLQTQITVQTENFTKQMEFVTGEVKDLRTKVTELEAKLMLKNQLLLMAIAHISVLESLIPEHLRPKRPEGLE